MAEDRREVAATEDQVLDAATTALGQRLAQQGRLSAVMDELNEAERADVEAAWERHGARMRALGRPGW